MFRTPASSMRRRISSCSSRLTQMNMGTSRLRLGTLTVPPVPGSAFSGAAPLPCPAAFPPAQARAGQAECCSEYHYPVFGIMVFELNR